MGFASRSVSIMRYRVKGEIQGSFWDTVHEGIKRDSFRTTDQPGELIGFGWTSIDDFDDCRLQGASYVRANYVALSFRIDTVRVPPRVLETELKKERRKLLERTGQKRISTNQLRELKEALKESLKSRVLPSIQVFDLVWDTSGAVAYLAALSVRARERVEDHFKKSFGLTLTPLVPFIRGMELLSGEVDRNRLDQLKSCIMAP
jgi:DNA recombination-dependent growth factor C